MGRWLPGARGRIAEAAMELYARNGFEQTTVAEIAKRAGVTERTFFRHFADKREVLFGGSQSLQEIMVNAVVNAPKSASPIDAVAAGALASTAVLNNRAYSRRRQRLITSNVDLQERELIKMASLAAAIAQALRRRGVAEPTASLTAQAGIAVFRVAFDRWAGNGTAADLPELIRESIVDLQTAVAGVPRSKASVRALATKK